MSGLPDFELPDLRFIEVERLVPHEQHDEQRSQPLVAVMRSDGVLRNPPVVAPLDDGRFVVLDGANRSTAARLAGLPHLVVQVVDYYNPDLRLSIWNHALLAFPSDSIEELLEELPDLVSSSDDPVHARAVLARRDAFAVIDIGDRALTLDAGSDLELRNRVLNRVVDSYRNRTSYHRVITESLAEARQHFPEVTALVVFPHFQRAEILELAQCGAKLPAGITRHVIPWRALRINVPLERMADRTQAAEEKTRWLIGWLKEKVIARRVRFYEESTVLFDE
jgi:hypothetical protein